MFKPRDQGEAGQGGPANGAAALSRAQAIGGGQAVAPGFNQRLLRETRSLGQQLAAIEWVPDLADNIGSRDWFRGLATMLGLAIFALSFWPDYSKVEAAPTMHLDMAARDEFRSQMIMPLALGADSGRRMGPTALVAPLASTPERPMVQLVATLVQGDSFGRMLQRAGVGAGDAARVSSLVAAQVGLGEIAPGTRFDITLGRRGAPEQPRPLDKLSFRARFDLGLAIDRRDGTLAVERKPIAVDDTPLRIRGVVGSSLYRSARAAGAPISAIQKYLQTLDAHLSLDTDIHPGDQFDIVVGWRRSATGETQQGDLLYAGLERGGRAKAQLLRWGSEGRFFEASGVGEQRSGTVMPVVGRLTSGFGQRFHPILNYTRMHAGVDFGAAYGSPIYAVGDGVVNFAGRHGGHGNYVKLDHGGGLATGYAHMSRIAVSSGTRVRAGQVIGYVGSSGLSTGPHLHYEVYKNGSVVNPLTTRFTMRAQLSGKELAAFKAKLAELKAVKPGAALESFAAPQAEAAEPLREIDRIAVAMPR